MGAQKAVGQGLVFAQQAQEQVFGLNVRRSELAGFIARKKDYAPRLFCVPLEHVALTSRNLPAHLNRKASLPSPGYEPPRFQEEAFFVRPPPLPRRDARLNQQRLP